MFKLIKNLYGMFSEDGGKLSLGRFSFVAVLWGAMFIWLKKGTDIQLYHFLTLLALLGYVLTRSTDILNKVVDSVMGLVSKISISK